MNEYFKTPILFILFNRPDTTLQVLEVIKKVKPKQLFIAADGPRIDKQGEAELCSQTRLLVINAIDWDCEVKTLFQDKNLGCREGVASAITWFFSNIEMGIILEDDCVPDLSFFPFCEEMLIKYKDESKIMHISGDNFLGNVDLIKASYYFSALCQPWGWATWSRAWAKYDKCLANFEIESDAILQKTFSDINFQYYFKEVLTRVNNRQLDTWDFAWYYTIWEHNGMAIIPKVNLVKNIGFGENATHTLINFLRENYTSHPINFPLKHPIKIKIHKKADLATFYHYYSPKSKSYIIISNLKYKLSKLIPQILKNYKRRKFDYSIKLVNYHLNVIKKRCFLKNKLPINDDNKVYVHLGCGEINWPKFINIDARPYKHVHYLSHVENLPFLKNNTSNLIYVSHCLEHISYLKLPVVLNEWYRILKFGGILRISVPDFNRIIEIYMANNNDIKSITGPLLGGQDNKYNFHYSIFNFDALSALLLTVGFKEVRMWEWGKDEFSSLPDFSGKKYNYNSKMFNLNLNIEAVK